MKLFLFLIFFCIYLARGIMMLDPDFGWHLRLGQIFMTKGVIYQDPFSYTMSHYPAIDHEWLTNALIALLYPAISMFGLSVLSAALTVLSLLLAIYRTPPHMRAWSILPLFLAASVLVTFSGVRPQVFTWFFSSTFYFLMFSGKLNSRKWLFIPLILLLWVNLHGGFAIGIVIFSVFLISKAIERKKLSVGWALVLVFSVLATFINPYGVRIWHEVWMQMSDQNLRGTISEWYPAWYMPNFHFWILFALSMLLIIRYQKKYSLAEKMIYFLLVLLGISSMRHAPLWAIFALTITTKGLYYLFKDASAVKLGAVRFKKALRFLFILVLLFSLPVVVYQFIQLKTSTEATFYPSKAVLYLESHPATQEIFTFYGWSGYLLWKLPQKKVFIHGMMPSWRQHLYAKESPYAFSEYINLVTGRESFISTSQRYGISTLLLPSYQDKYFFGNPDIQSAEKYYGSLSEQVKKARWKVVYKDAIAVIYSKE